ncbi:MAG: pyruvate formate-lyase-activating protein [Bacillota bacterium]
MKGKIHSIETLGLNDGPGIRTVIFFQGCKLRCKYCHNPDTWKLEEGQVMKSDEILKKVVEYKNYYNLSGGGVTISGGEPLLQPDYLLDLVKKLDKEDIHITLDTSGIGIGKYKEILKYIDLVLLDIKHFDPKIYKELTGKSVNKLNEFIKELNKANSKVWTRTVIVDDLNDSFLDMKNLIDYIKKIKRLEKIDLLPFKKLCLSKYKNLNLEFPYKEKCETNNKKILFLKNQLKNIIKKNKDLHFDIL